MLTIYLKHYPLTLLTLLAVLALSLLPIGRVELAEDVPLADKWTHMVMYAFLTAVLWTERWRHTGEASLRWGLAWGVVAPAVLGGAVELMQQYCTDYRSGEWLDWAADSVGALLGAAAGCAAGRWLSPRSSGR